jgi:hypothetical protein
MVTGIRQGEMKVLSSAARAAWERHMQHPAELAAVVAALLGLGFDVSPTGTRRGRSYRRALQTKQAVGTKAATRGARSAASRWDYDT